MTRDELRKETIEEYSSVKRTPIKAIRAFCIDCCGGQISEVRLCPSTDCPLYVYRFGKNPYSSRELTEEQKEAFRERMHKGDK